MGNFWGKIFGSDKVIDGAIKGIDAMFYTNQEKAEGKIKLLKAYEPYHLALRFIAMVITIPFVLMVMVAFGMSFYMSVDVQLNLLSDTLGMPFLAVVTFYFGNIIATKFGKK